MTFKMRSGNKPGFKSMGSSPAKDMKTGSYDHSFESPAKQKKDKSNDLKEFLISERGFTPADADKMISSGAYTKKDIDPGFKRKIVKPKKSTVAVDGQLNDAQKEYETDKKLYEKSKKDKPVKPTDEDMKKYSDLEKYDDDNPTGKAEPPKKKKTKVEKSPAKQKKVHRDGPKNKVHIHGGGTNKDPHWQPHQFKEKTSKYYYKIDGKPVTKQQYIKYKNVPGNMEGGGKQTNDPDVYGKKANNYGRGPKTKK
jgi:hypothetical protein